MKYYLCILVVCRLSFVVCHVYNSDIKTKGCRAIDNYLIKDLHKLPNSNIYEWPFIRMYKLYVL
jgi:hypothetical protein